MSRRRNISTDISLDPVLNDVINERGLLAGLLYTWMIPHAEDDCTLTGDPRKLMLQVIPGLRSVTAQDVVEALQALHDAGLITWDQEHKRISFPPSSFYRYQTYIPKAKRVSADNTDHHRKTPQITEEQQGSPQNPASPSPSPSPSPTKDTTYRSGDSGSSINTTRAQPDAPDGACVPVPKPQPKGKEPYSEDFERFWSAYPRKVEKQRAWRCWKTRLREGFEPEMLIEAAENYGAECRRAGTDERYRKHAATFLGPDKPFLEWLDIRAGPDDECHNPAHRDVTEEALREAAEIDWGDEDE